MRRGARQRSSASADRSPATARHDDLRRHARRAPVVLETERLENRRHVLAADVLEVERVAVDHLAAAQREDLDDGAVALRREADHVRGSDPVPLDRLPLDEMLHSVEPVAVPRRVLEPLFARRRMHLPLELALDRLHVAGEELDHAVDQRAVVLHARRSRHTARGSDRCGSRGTGCRCAGPASAPRTAGTGRRG